MSGVSHAGAQSQETLRSGDNEDADHIKYGADAFKLIAPRAPGSPSETIMNQLIKVREDARKKKED